MELAYDKDFFFLPTLVHTFEHIFIDIRISTYIYIDTCTFALLKTHFSCSDTYHLFPNCVAASNKKRDSEAIYQPYFCRN